MGIHSARNASNAFAAAFRLGELGHMAGGLSRRAARAGNREMLLLLLPRFLT